MTKVAEDIPLSERERFGELARIFARHGLGGLASRVGLASGPLTWSVEPDTPTRVVALLRDLGPVAIKLGQLLATRGDLLGPDWVSALSTLQDQVPSVSFHEIEPELVSSLGAPIADVFARFDRIPIAAASIAQVHGAALPDGTEVIVKVRRPGIATRVDADLRLLRRLARLAERRVPELRRLKIDELLRFFAESLSQEMDLSAEAAACEGIGSFLDTLGVRTPKFFWDYVGRRVNVQERLEGVSVRGVLIAVNEVTDAAAIAGTYADAILRMIIFHGRFHADPHPGNVFVLPSRKIAFIDFGATGTLTPNRRSELVTLVLAIAGENPRAVADVLINWSGDRTVEVDGLQRDLESLIGQFRGAVLKQVDLSEIFSRVFTLLRQYRLALPPDLALLLRTLLTAEGLVRTLDPEFDIAARAMPIARELARERISPAELRKGGRRLAAGIGRLAAASPDLIGLVEKVAKSGTIPVHVSSPSPNKEGPSPQRDVLAASLIVGGAVLFSQQIYVSLAFWGIAVVIFALTRNR
ncbi:MULTISPECIES: ABC1 kinase family protein [Sphingomonas]|uniref:ABC1 kinase family protein n=1 Tax=Sphingomonas TaxID=13687 RepID=UPI0009E7AE1C|nr:MULTISPECIES: AarF/UbiB family protein [Sphingomonas]MBN2972876.1 hypothetical protein [Roseomonas aeriglobus]MBY0300152.1 ubiquinone biosynthesis protein [Sphingomonas ginsenosidimutans]